MKIDGKPVSLEKYLDNLYIGWIYNPIIMARNWLVDHINNFHAKCVNERVETEIPHDIDVLEIDAEEYERNKEKFFRDLEKKLKIKKEN